LPYRVTAFLLFIVISSLLSSVIAQAKEMMPSLYPSKSTLRRTSGKFRGRRNKARSARLNLFRPAPSRTEIDGMVAGSASQFEVDPDLVKAIIKVESGFNTNAHSGKGARGLMQLIPETARRFGVKNAFNPVQNIAGGVAYLKHLLTLFSGNVPLSVAAYNAGEFAVLRRAGIPDYPETVDYVRKVTTLYKPGTFDTLIPLLVTNPVAE